MTHAFLKCSPSDRNGSVGKPKSVYTVSLREIKFFILDRMSSFHKMIAEKVIGGVCVKKHCFLLTRDVQASQRSVALIAEMIHTASLVHDDVIDDASSRRGKHTVNKIWGEKKVRCFVSFSSSDLFTRSLDCINSSDLFH